jgi:hypothetical protein
MRECLDALGRSCRNALYIDGYGKEHLPADPLEPEKAVIALEERSKRMALGSGIGCIIFLCISAKPIWELVQWWNGKWQPNITHLTIFGISGVGSAILLGTLSFRLWLRARKIRSKRFEVLRQDSFFGNKKSSVPVDGSSSQTEDAT